MKALDILSLIIKIVTAALGGLTAADASIVHLDAHTLGAIVGGLGTAGLAVKALQIKIQPVDPKKLNQ